MRVRVPASTANLGPGFDCLAMALDMFIEVSVEEADEWTLESTGEGSDLADNETHIASKVVRAVRGSQNFLVKLKSDIPVSRGLGSSAAVALALAQAAGAADPSRVAIDFDGHPENAMASYVGGLIAAATIDGRTRFREYPIDDRLTTVAVIPSFHLSTELARAALPPLYSRADVIHNLSRVPLLLDAFADMDKLEPGLFSDRIHQAYRATLHPFAEQVMAELVKIGCVGSCWSGAGSTLLGFCAQDQSEKIAEHMQNYCAFLGMSGVVRPLSIARTGLEILE